MPIVSGRIKVKTPLQIGGIRKSCKLAARTLDFIKDYVVEGVTTNKLNNLMEEYIRDHGAIPAPLNYYGYPKATCISLNEEVCHGIPSDRVLKNGDILNIDVTTILYNYYGDTSRMFAVGDISKNSQRIIDVSKKCLDLGIEQVAPGKFYGWDIGAAIEKYARSVGYSVVTAFSGHGTGIGFHEAPEIPHIPSHKTDMMKEGVVFTIEPMINEGKSFVEIGDDGWTARTVDKKLSAQWEHTILVTHDGCEVLTI